MREKNDNPVIKFKFFVKAERKLRGEGIYHAAVESQKAFRGCIIGAEWWKERIDAFNELVYSRDLWSIMDVFHFAVCGANIPENYYDLNYEDAEEVRARKKERKEAKEKMRRTSMLAEESERTIENKDKRRGSIERKAKKKKRGENNYQYMHYGVSTTQNSR